MEIYGLEKVYNSCKPTLNFATASGWFFSIYVVAKVERLKYIDL